MYGIVLMGMKHGDNGRIVRIFTREEGMLSFITRVKKGKRTASKSVLLMPLALLKLEARMSSRGDLHSISECTTDVPLKQVHGHIDKCAQAMFVAELLTRTLKEGESNERMFDFLSMAIQWLDESERHGSFHVAVLISLSRFLGFAPHLDRKKGIFDLREGRFLTEPPLHPDYLEGASADHLFDFCGMDLEAISSFVWGRMEKNEFVNDMLRFYAVQLEHFQGMKSHHVLQETFD